MVIQFFSHKKRTCAARLYSHTDFNPLAGSEILLQSRKRVTKYLKKNFQANIFVKFKIMDESF